MKKLIFAAVFVPFLLLAALGITIAQEPTPPPIIIEPPIMPPDWNFEGLSIEYQRVNVTIEDQVATTHIEQLFVNDNDWMLEGTYLFPLPEGAAVSQLTMWVDGQPIEAKILEKEEARQIYDEIVRTLRDPALLEYVGTSAIQANVFPIPPRDERRIEIEYTQVLPADNGLIHYVYPQSTDLYTNTPLNTQSIRVEVRSREALRAIYSPSHRVAIERDGEFLAIVGFEEENVTADTDFELYYSVSPQDIGLNLLSYKEAGQDGFFLLLAAPSVEVDEVVAKDVILVMDTSGSMEGEKMAQAKQAALYVVEHLNPEDRFNIVSFSTGVRSFTRGLTPASDAGGYRGFINSLEAVGGTNISQALLEAAAQAGRERPTTIIFLTDGLATEGITDTSLLLDAVKEATPDNVRIFAFGVGDDVDTTLLDSLTQNHRGTTTYVRPMQSIDEEVSSFYAKVSAPVLTDISLDFDGIMVEQLYPQTLPDLFAGSQLVLVGRYREGGPAAITLRGTVNGREQAFVYEDNLFRTRGGDDFIPRLWATRAIGHLLTQIRLHGDDLELVQSVINLSIRYGIITPYTSYLIEEDDILSQTSRDTMFEEAAAGFEAPPMEVSGEKAVERAADEAEMAAAETAPILPAATMAPMPGMSASEAEAARPIQFAGSKTFVWRDGMWIDTAFDPDTQEPQRVGFASDAYFDLLTAVPDVGQYLALGQHVLFVYEEMVYEVVAEEGETAVDLPEVAAVIEPVETATAVTIVSTRDDVPQSGLVTQPVGSAAPTADSLLSVGLGIGILSLAALGLLLRQIRSGRR
ncbi:MAG: VIT domain-containing protein [Anaerolineae bacterium]